MSRGTALPPSEGERSGTARRWTGLGLSNKLLLLTIVFVMIAEVLIYIPSIANYRNIWLGERLSRARLVVMAANATPQGGVSGDIAERMLETMGIEAIAVRTRGQRWLLALHQMPSEVSASHDLTGLKPFDSIRAAFATLFSRGDGMILVSGPPPQGADRFEIVVQESRLRTAMLVYSRNILLLSLVISIITAALVYVALRALIVRPMERLSANILAFSEAPEDASTVIRPSGRTDEIGAAEERLAEMQNSLRDMLSQRRHLADLGLAVSKINHDLRNMLASAQLFSDRLGATEDPLVKRFAPKIVGALDRAIGYTRSVLAYGQAKEDPPRRQLLSLARLADDVADVLALSGHDQVRWENRIGADVEVDADPDQLFRVVMNLCRNALEAVSEGADPAVIRRVWVEGERHGGVAVMRVCDTGRGVPARAKAALFQAFQGSARPGGTGLGLAIAAELVRAHGGSIELVDHAGAGAVFQFTIPDRPVDLQARRQVRGA
jgi:signal transduction histidine kinase